MLQQSHELKPFFEAKNREEASNDSIALLILIPRSVT
jgi:hypothetical protein